MTSVFAIREIVSEQDKTWKDKPYKSIKARVSGDEYSGLVEIFRPAFLGSLPSHVEGTIENGQYGVKLREAMRKGNASTTQPQTPVAATMPQPAPMVPQSVPAAAHSLGSFVPPAEHGPLDRDRSIIRQNASTKAVELVIYLSRIEHASVTGVTVEKALEYWTEFFCNDILAYAGR